MPPRLSPALTLAVFSILLAVLANLAWGTASSTTRPWYDTSTSLEVYASTWVVATVVAIALVIHASMLASAIETSRQRIDRDLALLRGTARWRLTDMRSEGDPVRPDVPDPALIFEGLASAGMASPFRLEKDGHDSLVSVPYAGNHSRVARETEVCVELQRARDALRRAQSAIWTTAAGPITLSIIFLAIAGPMLPGSGGFASAQFRLNTALILFLSYGLPALGVWAVLSLGSMGTMPERPER